MVLAPPYFTSLEDPIFSPAARFVLAIFLISGKASADDKQTLLRRALGPIQKSWSAVYPVLRNRDVFPADKARAVDNFFDEIRTQCEGHCERIGEFVDAAVETFSDDKNPLKIEKPQAFKDLWETYGSKLDPQQIRERLPGLFNLARQILALEEENLYAIMSSGDPLTNRIGAGAGIADSASFIYRQGRALLRLAFILKEISEKAGTAGDDASGGDGKMILGMKVAYRTAAESIDEFLPRIVAAVEDLGVYYVKLAQTFGTLAYAVSPEAYEKFERFQNDNTTRMSEPDVVATIERDLGGPWQKFYAELDLRPFANASNAQIHDAKIRLRNGKLRDVVVKVKKGYVEQELNWNQRVNALIFEWVRVEWLKGKDSVLFDLFVGLAANLGETFRSELDYPAEAIRQEYMRRTLGTSRAILIPRVHTHLSGRSIITMDKITGMQKFGASLRHSFAPPKRETVADESNEFVLKIGEQRIRISASDAKGEDADPQDEEAAATDDKAAVEADAEAAPDQAAAADEEGDDEKNIYAEAFHEFYKKANKEVGLKVGAQYLQFFVRGLGPPISIFLAYIQAKKHIDATGGVEALTEEQRAEWTSLSGRFKALMVAMIDMTLHLGELHSDLQPANAMELIGTEKTVLLDWGQTVKTRGLVFNPIRLTWALMRGDDLGAARALSRIGTLRADKTFHDLAPLVREFMDKADFERRGRIATVRSLRNGMSEEEEESEEDVLSESEKVKPAVGQAEGPPERLRPDYSPRVLSDDVVADDEISEALNMRSDGGGKKPTKSRKTPQQQIADVIKETMNLLLDFPIRRLEYFALGIYARGAQWADRTAGQRIARAQTTVRYRRALREGHVPVLKTHCSEALTEMNGKKQP